MGSWHHEGHVVLLKVGPDFSYNKEWGWGVRKDVKFDISGMNQSH